MTESQQFYFNAFQREMEAQGMLARERKEEIMKPLEERKESARESLQERAENAISEFVKILMDSDENEVLSYTETDMAELIVGEVKRVFKIK